jgi:hypothetical protein
VTSAASSRSLRRLPALFLLAISFPASSVADVVVLPLRRCRRVPTSTTRSDRLSRIVQVSLRSLFHRRFPRPSPFSPSSAQIASLLRRDYGYFLLFRSHTLQPLGAPQSFNSSCFTLSSRCFLASLSSTMAPPRAQAVASTRSGRAGSTFGRSSRNGDERRRIQPRCVRKKGNN